MCGIAGYIVPKSTGEDRLALSLLKKMTQTLIHRGPDDEGYYQNEGVGLGHRRLSIIDLSSGRQPLSNEDESLWLICNGEIFNFITLRTDLEKKGHSFRSKSDSEVILHLYEEYGDQFLEHLRGQFAFALYDERQRKLILVRDRMGQKPLYYYRDEQKILFGSEMKALLAFGDLKLSLNGEALPYYLELGYFPHPHTQFREIHKLPQAHKMVIQNGKVNISRYWQPPPPAFHSQDFSLKKGMEDLWDHLKEATRLRLVSEVPLGAFLSGGVDSSMVVAVMTQLSSIPVKTFCISFQEKSYDESPYADQIAKHLKTDHTNIPVDFRIEELMEKVLGHFDEPFADSSAIPQYLVSQATRKHVTVALSGDAGDEIFGGYRRYLGRRLSEKYNRLPRGLRNLILSISRKGIREGDVYIGRSVKKMFMRFLVLSQHLEQNPLSAGVPFFDEKGVGDLLTDNYAKRYGESPLENPLAPYVHANGTNAICQMIHLDQQSYLPDDILVKVDRMSMAHGLEVRSPFLDHRLVEWAACLPLKAKLSGFTGKYILKKLAEKFLPKEVIYRRKQGFALPIPKWFREDLKDLVEDELFSKGMRESGIFNPQAMRRFYDEHLSGQRDWSQQLWALLALKYTYKSP